MDAAGAREEQLARNGYNPVMLSAEEVRHDLLTDSWVELDHLAVGERMADLTVRSFEEPDLVDGAVSWLPFKHVVATSSGRAAEALLCRLWPGRRGTVLHNGLFATWLFNLADCGFRPLSLGVAGGTEPFPADVDLVALEAALAASGPVSFLCLEIGSNAGGGRPMSLRNLRAVRQVLGDDVPMVLDATRIVENAYGIIADEPGHGGSDVWNVVHDLLAVADAVTISMSKDFGIDFGGLLATGRPELSELLTADGGAAGRSVHRVGRQMLATAAGDLDAVAALVRVRMQQTATLWRRLHEAGAPVGAAPGGHCVVLNLDLMPDFALLAAPVPSLLASLYRETGVRGGPHLGVPGENRVRLAVPVGMTAAELDLVGDVVTRFFAEPAGVLDVVPLTPSGDAMRAAQGAYRLATDTLADASPPPANPNLDMVREFTPHAVARMVPVPGGAVEIIEAGSGPTLLLMPPFNLGAGVFAHQFAAFSADHRVVAVHRPGVGRTRWDGDLGLEQVAAVHREVLDRLEVEGRVHVVGMSFGGLQAQAFALHHPERTATLTLIASSYRFANREGGVDRLERVVTQDLDGAIAGSGSVRLTAERDALIAALVRCESMDPRTGMRYLDVFAEHADLQDRLADIATPTLVVHGRYDSVVPLRTVHVLHGLIADSRLAEIDDAGHFACFTSPEQVNAVLGDFLENHSATS
jgi:tryptophanase/pimeloyl-ACP methyl ester carboxylesterase